MNERGATGIASMTGFARIDGEAAGASFYWELKSVNGRSLDLRVRLPPGFDSLEPELRNALSGRFRRGTLSASLYLTRTTAPALRVNREALAELLRLMKELAGEIEAAPPRLDGVLALRGVVETVEEERAEVVEERRLAIFASWTTALERLAAARSAEGARLAALLQGLIAEMSGRLEEASSSAAAQPAAIRQRLEAALAGFAGVAPPLTQERVAQELALILSRADVREEIERLRAHLDHARELLREGEAVGRRLDFLCQELNREANTLCAKSADIALTRAGLALKAAVEQFREQAQNIE
jgi:uncharacterized protein (TIGR00255 family)